MSEPTAREWIAAVYREEPPHNQHKIEQALEAAAEIADEAMRNSTWGTHAGDTIRAFAEEIAQALSTTQEVDDAK